MMRPLLRHRVLPLCLCLLRCRRVELELHFERADHKDLEGEDNEDGGGGGDDVFVVAAIETDS